MKKFARKFYFCKTLFVVLIFVLVSGSTRAADGGGTNTVSPTAAPISSTGNTFTFTYTGDATKDSGGMTIAVPSGWSAPQGNTGTAGYTTTSSTGTVGTVSNVLDATTNWTAGNHMALTADTSDKQEGTGSLSNAIGTYGAANDQWYYSPASSENWGTNNGTGNYHVGMWLKSSVTTTSGQLSFQLDDTAALASPLDTIAVAGLTANTWTYTSATLGAGARATVVSYGLQYTTDIGAATVKTDSISALFDDADVTTNWTGDASITVAALGSAQEGSNAIQCTYAAAAGTGTLGDCNFTKSSAETWGPGTTVSFWIRSSVATSAGDFDWVDDNAAALASVEDSVDIPALSANTWTYVTLSLASTSAGKAAKSWGVRQQVDKGALTLDLDAMGKMVNAGDSTSLWTAAGSGAQALSADTTTKKEGTGSLRNTIGAGAVAGDKWWETYGSTQDWSSYTTVGLWVYSSVTASAGDLQFEYDDQDELASPIATLNIGALSAGAWSYQKLTLSGTRTAVKSYGIKYATDIGAASVYLDYFLLGPGLPTFSGAGPWTITVIFLALANTQTVTVTYGSGGGTSGVTAPGSATTDTFTTNTRDASDGTLSPIASSPTITANTTPALGTISDSPDPVTVGSDVTFSSGTWTDSNGSETVKMFVCKTNSLTSQSTGGCAGGTWFASGSYTSTNPQTGTYTALAADVGTSPNSYYTFLCDAKQVSNSCSSSSTSTFTANAVSQSLTFSVSDNTIGFGTLSSSDDFFATGDLAGSATETAAHTLTAATNATSGYVITLNGATLTSGGNTITAIGSANTASSPTTEQFGLRMTVTSGNGTVAAPYAAAGFAFDTAAFPDQVASGAGDGTSTVFSARYLANISGATEVGTYTATLTYVATATF